jgi:hypothetical protein
LPKFYVASHYNFARDGTGTGDRLVRSGTVPDFRPAGLPFDRSITVRPAGRRSTGWLPFDRPVAVRPVITDLSYLLLYFYYLINNA